MEGEEFGRDMDVDGSSVFYDDPLLNDQEYR